EEHVAVDDRAPVALAQIDRALVAPQHGDFIVGQLEQEAHFAPLRELGGGALQLAIVIERFRKRRGGAVERDGLAAAIAERFEQAPSRVLKRLARESADRAIDCGDIRHAARSAARTISHVIRSYSELARACAASSGIRAPRPLASAASARLAEVSPIDATAASINASYRSS